MNIDLTIVVYMVLGSILVAIIAYIVGPKLSYERELKRIYEAPFRRGCAIFYGEALEFYKRYITPLAKNQPLDVSVVQKIDDFMALHESQLNVPIWLGKIENENEDVAERVWNFVDAIDRLWHEMESKFGIRRQLFFREDILRLGPKERENIADFLMDRLKNQAKKLEKNRKEILGYFKGKIPQGFWIKLLKVLRRK